MNNDITILQEILNLHSKTKEIFLYYSKTSWKLLFQRPHQIMRFMDKNFLKIR